VVTSSERSAVINAAYLGVLGLAALTATAMMATVGLPGLPCVFRSVFGIPCPGCGMTRSMMCVWHGDLVGSLRYHPLGMAVFLAICAGTIGCWLYVALPTARPGLGRVTASLRKPRVGWAVLAILLLVWAFRLADAFEGWRLFRW
jgi:hypothetical protein